MPTKIEDRIDTRIMTVRSATIDEKNRSIEAVLSSEQSVEMWDWRSSQIIDEILLVDGVTLPRQIPLLAIHSRYSLDDVLGSVRSIRSEIANGINQIIGRLFFATGDSIADRAWNKVREGHIEDISVGYRITKPIEVAVGEKVVINDTTYTAVDHRLRIGVKWMLREASIVPIGADKNAKIRADDSAKKTEKGALEMPKKLREYLVSIGMRTESTDEESWKFVASLKGEHQDFARKLVLEIEDDQRSQSVRQIATGNTNTNTGSDVVSDDLNIRSDDAESVQTANQACDEERQRVIQLRELAGSDVSREILDEAISAGSSVADASLTFLAAVRGQRMRDTHQAPAGHGIDRGNRITVRSLSAGMMIGNGIDPVGQNLHNGHHGRIHHDAITEQDADYGDELARMSAIDLVRECAHLDNGGRTIMDRDEAIRVAVSGTSLDRVFTTNAYAHLLAGWDEILDTTAWCQEEDVPNFLTQEDITLRAKSQLERHPRGATAKHATAEDDYETYKVWRYAKQFVVDEQDIINDRLGAIMIMPREMGQAARRIRPDLVYAILLANDTLTATGGALFNNTAETTIGGHKNLGSTILGSAGLKSAISAMAAHRLDPGGEKVPLNIRPRWLIVPPDLEWTARELLTAGEIRDTTADTKYPTINVLRDVGLSLIVESRIDASGVTDPATEITYAGSTTNYFLAAGRRTVKVAYLRGTGRRPQIRSFQLDKGQWGIGWDVKMDVGAAAVDFRGMQKGNS